MSNAYLEFLGLLPPRLLLVGTVTSITSGVATVTLPGGGRLQVRGETTLGARVFVRDGLIEGPAATLTYVEGEG